jgi:hypothetical protein
MSFCLRTLQASQLGGRMEWDWGDGASTFGRMGSPLRKFLTQDVAVIALQLPCREFSRSELFLKQVEQRIFEVHTLPNVILQMRYTFSRKNYHTKEELKLLYD